MKKLADSGMRRDWSKTSSEALVQMLPRENPINKCGIICELASRDKHTSSERSVITSLKNDRSIFWNVYTVSDFACAALDVLGWEKYTGDKEEVNNLIGVKLILE